MGLESTALPIHHHKRNGAFGMPILLLRPDFPRTILSLAAHLSALTSVMIACAFTCKAVTLSYAFGAIAGAVFYLVLLAIVWE